MIHVETQCSIVRAPEADEFLGALDQLSARDQHILGRLVRRLAVVERASGEEVALALAEQMEAILRGRASRRSAA
jgi:hypothetical protein